MTSTNSRGSNEPPALERVRPRMLFLRYGYESGAPRFLVSHADEHIRCLAQHFDVTVVSHDCDYAEICDRHAPDVTLFEVGLQLRRATRLRIKNINSNLTIPRIGLLNADPWGGTRSLALSDFDYLKLQAVFCIGVTTGAHFVDAGCPIFYWPNFIDPEVFHDYQQEKLVSVTLTGAMNPSYPWRQSVFGQLSAEFPCISIPHLGYSEDRPAFRMPSGVAYAKLINAARVAPTCGSIAGELIRKHLEIPACRTALVTEDTLAVRATGFVDMENCVFANEKNVVATVAGILSSPDILAKITDAGHDLVHRQHTMRNRTQIFDWFQLTTRETADQRIIQEAPFSALSLAPGSDAPEATVIFTNAQHLKEISAGHAALRGGRSDEADRHFARALEYFDTLAEARLGQAICRLMEGKPGDAIQLTACLIKDTLGRHDDVDPDPAEWAQLIVCHLCLGEVHAALRRAMQYEHLKHPDLSHIRLLLLGAARAIERPADRVGSRTSLHRPLADDLEEYQLFLNRLLLACGQARLAEKISSNRLGVARFTVRLERALLPIGPLKRLLGRRSAYLPGSGLLRGLDNPLLVRKLARRTFQPRSDHVRADREA